MSRRNNESPYESRQFWISVEGECEEIYFDHLEKLMNQSGRYRYQAKIICRKLSPLRLVKREGYKFLPHGKGRPSYFHIQDIEDYYDAECKKKFYNLLDEFSKVQKEHGVECLLGYSNYTFELWLLLHIHDMSGGVTNRTAYLTPINQYFQKSFASLHDFKSEKAYRDIMDEYITLDSVKLAVARADEMVARNAANGKEFVKYKNFGFYKDNPDLTVHEVVKKIFETCKEI